MNTKSSDLLSAALTIGQTIEKSLNYLIKTDGLVLPPKTFNINIFKLKVNGIQDMLCREKEIAENIFVLEGIVPNDNGLVKIVISNENDIPIKIDRTGFNIELENLDNYSQEEFQENFDSKINEKERLEYLKKHLPTDHLSDEFLPYIHNIMENFHDVFYIEGDNVSFTNAGEHHIPLKPDSKPVFTPQYRIPYFQRPIVDEKIEELK